MALFRSLARSPLTRQTFRSPWIQQQQYQLPCSFLPFVQCRTYISDTQVRQQYRRLFRSCDLDSSGYVTFNELHSTLFRFGLADLDAKEPDLLRRTFDEAIQPTCDEKDALSPESFEAFIQRAVFLKTEFDNTLPEGKSPLFWRKFKLELRHYGSSFNLLYNQTRSASALLVDHGWRMTKEERKMVMVAVFDFIKTLPFAALLVAPMGSLLVPLVAKLFPALLPTAFYSTDPTEWNNKDRTEKLAITSLEVASRILLLEKKLREANEMFQK